MKIIAIALKDLRRSTRNWFFLGMALAMPLLITALIYFAFGSLLGGEATLTPIKVGVVNQDALPAGAPLEAPVGDALRGIFFDASVQAWLTATDYADEAAARAAVDAQAVGAAVVIPPTLTADLLAGREGAPVVIVQDPTLAIAPAVTRDMVTAFLDGVAGGGIAYQTVAARQTANGLTPDPAGLPGLLEAYASWYAAFQRALFHSPDTAALSLVAPAVGGQAGNALQTVMGLMMAGQLVFFSFFTGGYAMMTLLEEQEDGLLGRLFTTPTGRTTILAGKFLAAFVTVLAQGLVLLIAGHFAFGINWGDPAAAALTLFGQMLASVGLAAALVSLVKTSKQAGPVVNAVLTGLGMLSGLFTTNIQMPAAFNALGNLTPQGWVLKAWRLTLAGQPVSELWLPVGVLAATGLVLFLIGAGLFRRRFA